MQPPECGGRAQLDLVSSDRKRDPDGARRMFFCRQRDQQVRHERAADPRRKLGQDDAQVVEDLWVIPERVGEDGPMAG